jgi:hypothetical protein
VLTGENFERDVIIATTEIKRGIENLIKQRESDVSLMREFVKDNYCAHMNL